uniref:Uncharacterized protein n=1 Tax=viral metagenome TaxID=1070528 RepID=A0A6M3KLP1_9ZZZZ
MVAPGKYILPYDLTYVQLLCETGWPPNILDEVPLKIIHKYIIYKNVKATVEVGGEYQP